MKDLEARQAEMKQRQKSPHERKIISCGLSSEPPPVQRPKIDHHCGGNVDFCPFCGVRVMTETGERHANGMPKMNHRCERRNVDFCPFCGDRLIPENAENSRGKPQPVVVSRPSAEAKRVRVIRANKIRRRKVF